MRAVTDERATPLKHAFRAWLAWSVFDAFLAPRFAEALIGGRGAGTVVTLGPEAGVVRLGVFGILFLLTFEGVNLARVALWTFSLASAAVGAFTAWLQLDVMRALPPEGAALRPVMLLHVGLALAGVLVDLFVIRSLTRPEAVLATRPDLALARPRAAPAPLREAGPHAAAAPARGPARPSPRRVKDTGMRLEPPAPPPIVDPLARADARVRAAAWAWAAWLALTVAVGAVARERFVGAAPVDGATYALALAAVLVPAAALVGLALWDFRRTGSRTSLRAARVPAAAGALTLVVLAVAAAVAFLPVDRPLVALVLLPWHALGVAAHLALPFTMQRRAAAAGDG